MVKANLLLTFALLVSTANAATLDIVDTLPGTFIDISTTGINLGIAGDDEVIWTTAISNLVFPAGDIVIGNNGGLGFGDVPDPNLAPLNAEIPSAAAFGAGQAVLGFWDDIGNTLGNVYLEEFPGDRLIVQWDGKGFDDDPGGGTITFQIQIFDNVRRGVPIYTQIIYADVEQPRAGGGASATIGYQDGGAGFNDVQWSYNTAGAVSNGTVLSLIPEPTGLVLLAAGALAASRRRAR